MHDIDYRITALSGEHYYFKEAALALSRTLRRRKEDFDLWHPAECTGEVGAASGATVIALVQAACAKGYTPGSHILAHWTDDDGQRAAATLQWIATATCPPPDKEPLDGQPGICQQHGGVLQGRRRQVHLRLPGCLLHPVTETGHAARRADP